MFGVKVATKIASVDTRLLYAEMMSNIDLLKNLDAFYANSHKDFKTVELRVPRLMIKNGYKKSIDFFKLYANQLYTKDTAAKNAFPVTMSFIEDFAKQNKGYVGRISLTILNNEIQFYPHIDMGYYYIFNNRYHLIIKSDGSDVLDNGNILNFRTGDLYSINNLVPHSGKASAGNSERIHLIFDIFPKNIFVILYKYITWLFVYRNRFKKYPTSLRATLLSPLYLFRAITMVLFSNDHS